MDREIYKNWRDLIKPKSLTVDKETLTASYGKFYAEPLERGFGITLGNSLRRVLLSSLQGAAVTTVRIDGALHEFTSLPGITEDVSDIILNIKDLLIKMRTWDQKTLRIDKRGPAEIRGSDVEVDSTVEILNKDLLLATVGPDGHLNMEMTCKKGRGYVQADGNKSANMPVGAIPIDSIFSPVKKVNYHVTNARTRKGPKRGSIKKK